MRFLVVNLVLSIFLYSCQQTPITPTPPIGSFGNLECSLNSSQWAGVDFENSVIYVVQGNIDGNRLDIRATGSDGLTMILTVSDVDRSMGEAWIDTGYYHTDSLNNVALITMLQGTNLVGTAAIGLLGYGEVHVSSCNSITQLVSGTFSFEIYDPMDSTLLFSAQNGVFTDCQYSYYQ